MMIADMTPTVPWGTTGAWLVGAFGVLGAATLVVTFANQYRKLFGRRPPVDDELDKIRKSVKALDEKYEDRMAALQADRERAWKELTASINEVSNDVSFLRGRVDPHYKRSHAHS